MPSPDGDKVETVTRLRFPGADVVSMNGDQVPRVWEVERFEREGRAPTIRARVEVRNGKPELRDFSLTAPEGGGGLDVAVIRDFDFEGMIEHMGGMAIAHLRSWDGGKDGSSATVDDIYETAHRSRLLVRAARRTEMTDEHLAEVARVYRTGSRSPVQDVADHFGKTLRTGTNYVRLARERGFLTDED